MTPSTVIEVATSSDQRDTLEKISIALVEQRLVACAQISGPIRSVYRWKAKIETADEWIGHFKTASTFWPKICQVIGDLHNYDLPQITATACSHISPEFEQWIYREISLPLPDSLPAGPVTDE